VKKQGVKGEGLESGRGYHKHENVEDVVGVVGLLAADIEAPEELFEPCRPVACYPCRTRSSAREGGGRDGEGEGEEEG